MCIQKVNDAMKLICVDPRTDDVWQRLIDRHPCSSVFHSPAWMTVLAETYEFEIQAYILLDAQDEPAAGVPFCRIEDMRGVRAASLPFCDFCDPLVSTEAEWREISGALLSEGHPFVIRCLHNEIPLTDSRFRVSKQAMWHGLSLEPDMETLWGNLDGSARRAVRKAEKEGVCAIIAEDPSDMRHFFDMHLGIRKNKYGLLAQPYGFFEQIWSHLIDTRKGFLMLAEHEGKIIGGVIYLIWRGTLIYKFSASMAQDLAQRPTDLLIWEGIRHGHAQGLGYFDFGLSDLDQEGLNRFKRKFADKEKTINFLVANEREQPGIAHRQVGTVLGEMTQLFTQRSVPDDVTEAAGALLYRYFA